MAFLQSEGAIVPEELARTFNCGIGMVVVLAEDEVAGVTEALEAAGEKVFRIGRVDAGEKGCTVAGPAGSFASAGDWTATHHG